MRQFQVSSSKFLEITTQNSQLTTQNYSSLEVSRG